jgi:hypothetical protein
MSEPQQQEISVEYKCQLQQKMFDEDFDWEALSN